MTDWSDVRTFLEVSRGGTLADAARRLGVNSTTVARRLAAMERALGARLFERTPDGRVLTAAGESMRGAAEEMEQAALRGERRVLGDDQKLIGLVRIAATELIGREIVLPAIAELRRTHPLIRVDLATGPDRLDVARREADVALRFVRPDDGGLVVRRIARIAFAAYASRETLAKQPRPVRGSGFAGHDLVAFDTGIRAWRAGELAGETLREARTVLRANNSYSLLDAVALGIGLGAIPCLLGDRDPRVRRIFPEVPPDLDDVFLVVHRDVQRTSRVRAVIDALTASFAGRERALLGMVTPRR